MPVPLIKITMQPRTAISFDLVTLHYLVTLRASSAQESSTAVPKLYIAMHTLFCCLIGNKF